MKDISNLDLSKVPGPDCIHVVVLKKCEPELYHTSRTLNICLKKSCWKVSSVIPVSKNAGGGLLLKLLLIIVNIAKTYC